MNRNNVFTATAARQRFFEILQLVEKGKDAFIVKKDRNIKFKISLLPREQKPSKLLIAKRITKIALKSTTPEKMSKIFDARLKI